MKTKKIIYWVSTSLVLRIVGLGSIADFLSLEAVEASIKAIGFPSHIRPFLGVMKILGCLAILIPQLSRFREAAYSGLVFYFVGALYAHFAVGDGPDRWGFAALCLVLIIISYLYAPKHALAESSTALD